VVRLSAKSEGRGIRLTRADAHRMVEVDDEDLAVADLAGLGSGGDGVDGLVDLIRGPATSILILGMKLTAYSAPR